MRSSVLAVRLDGGLGNQLFIYAASLSIARSIGVQPRYYHTPGVRMDVLESFLSRELPRASSSEIFRAAGTPPDAGPLHRFVMRNLERTPPARRRTVSSVLFEPVEFPDRRDGVLHLTGFCQHPSYWEDSLQEVVQQLLIHPRARPPADEDAVALHLRRVDYVNQGWALDVGYYLSALQLADPSRDGRIAVTSDDPLAAVTMAAYLREKGYDAQSAAGGDATADFWTLAAARHVVMSNSTFCWWACATGDTLHEAADRVVAYPEPWLPIGHAELQRPGWSEIHH